MKYSNTFTWVSYPNTNFKFSSDQWTNNEQCIATIVSILIKIITMQKCSTSTLGYKPLYAYISE